VSFFPDDRAHELRELFFESATELLQTLNDEGLKLEKHPQDEKLLRQVRRTVHTLKGDSAACGYTEFSELAHRLEDLLRPEVAATSRAGLAEIVLIAADSFGSMLSAYRNNLQPPASEELLHQIVSLTRKPKRSVRSKLRGRFLWSEYEQVVVQDALRRGEKVYNVAFSIDAHCPMRGAAMQLIRNVLQECGRLLAIAPDQSTLPANMDVVEASLASEHPPGWVEKKCRIPAVISDVLVARVTGPSGWPPENGLDILKHVTAPGDGDELAAGAEETPASLRTTQRAATEAQQPELPASFSSIAENLLRVDAERIDVVLNLVGELIIAKSMLHQAINEFDKRFPKDALRGRFSDAIAFQARIMNDLQKSVMKIRMVPVEHLFRRFPRVVRDVAKSCGKEVTLVVTGQDTD